MGKMRVSCAWALLLCLLAGTPVLAAPQTCGPQALGVARTLEIDTRAGPRFGFQYQDPGLLADGEVILTFDDGPLRAYTRPILETLAAHCTKATFFLVGRMAVADPEMVQEYARQGHTVGTHTWSHANLPAMSQARAQDEIELGVSAVQHALGKPIAPFFRFPYLRDGAITLGHVKARRVATFSIDIDSRDFETRDAATVYARVMREVGAKRKGIILFHDIHASTVRALPRILDELKAHNFRVVHVVPKAGMETIAEYDEMTREAANRRRVASAGHPLAKRAIIPPAGLLTADGMGAAPPPAPTPRPAPQRGNWIDRIWDQAY